jgi:hypothetical protein
VAVADLQPGEVSVMEFIGGARLQPAYAPDLGRGDDWRDNAACLDTDPTLFDPIDDESKGLRGRLRIARAKTVFCDSCPVAADCLADGIEKKTWGLRGGVYLENGKPNPHPGRGRGAA